MLLYIEDPLEINLSSTTCHYGNIDMTDMGTVIYVNEEGPPNVFRGLSSLFTLFVFSKHCIDEQFTNSTTVCANVQSLSSFVHIPVFW